MPLCLKFREPETSRARVGWWRAARRGPRAAALAGGNMYVPWLCHEEEEGVFDFEGQNDLRAFVTLIGELGMEAVIRILSHPVK